MLNLNVKNLRTKNDKPAANQFYVNLNYGQGLLYQSYDSKIIEIDTVEKEINIYPDWNYSKTTSMYRNQFLRTVGFDELTEKDAIWNAMCDGKVTIKDTEYKVNRIR